MELPLDGLDRGKAKAAGALTHLMHRTGFHTALWESVLCMRYVSAPVAFALPWSDITQTQKTKRCPTRA